MVTLPERWAAVLVSMVQCGVCVCVCALCVCVCVCVWLLCVCVCVCVCDDLCVVDVQGSVDVRVHLLHDAEHDGRLLLLHDE